MPVLAILLSFCIYAKIHYFPCIAQRICAIFTISKDIFINNYLLDYSPMQSFSRRPMPQITANTNNAFAQFMTEFNSSRGMVLTDVEDPAVNTMWANTSMLTLFCVLCVLALMILSVVCVFLYKKYRTESTKLRQANLQLAEMRKVKDLYIKRIMMVAAVNIRGFESLTQVLTRKLKAGQCADALRLVESRKPCEEQLRSFHEIFDPAFLAVYPDFAEQVNRLLVAEHQLTNPSQGKLNTDLRLLAFMRLGIDDQQQVATFLGVTLNTVYTYRNKLRARAKNRSEFEDSIKKISASS